MLSDIDPPRFYIEIDAFTKHAGKIQRRLNAALIALKSGEDVVITWFHERLIHTVQDQPGKTY